MPTLDRSGTPFHPLDRTSMFRIKINTIWSRPLRLYRTATTDTALRNTQIESALLINDSTAPTITTLHLILTASHERSTALDLSSSTSRAEWWRRPRARWRHARAAPMLALLHHFDPWSVQSVISWPLGWDILAQGLIELIEYSYQQGASSFR
jgi:hypothetical protein